MPKILFAFQFPEQTPKAIEESPPKIRKVKGSCTGFLYPFVPSKRLRSSIMGARCL